MKTPDQMYWNERFSALEQSLQDKSLKHFDDIAKAYKKAIKNIEKDLLAWYGRYATNENISIAEARKILSKGELDAFKMTVQEYIEKGQNLDPAWIDELEKASIRVHVTRLEALKFQIQEHVEQLSAQTAFNFNDYANSVYKDQYYHTAFEIQKGIGIGWDLKTLDKAQVERVISKPWAADGKNFSERIWSNRTKLVNQLHTILSSAIARGQNPSKTIDELSHAMSVSKVNAGRLVMTESAFFASTATKKVFDDLDVEKYQILATLDRRTSITCRDMDGLVFKRTEFEVATTAPPFHCHCRTTTVPFFDDDYDIEGFRASRGDDNRYYLVPENMTYHEWEQAFVDGTSSYKDEINLKIASDEDLSNAVLKINRNSDLFKKYGQNHYLALHDLLKKNASDEQLKLWAHYESQLGVTTATGNPNTAYYSPLNRGITINIESDARNQDFNLPYEVSFHELGHNIDHLAGIDIKNMTGGVYFNSHYSVIYKDGLFGETLRKEIKDTVDAKLKEIKKKAPPYASSDEMREFIQKELNIKIPSYKPAVINRELIYYFFSRKIRELEYTNRGILSDLFGGVTKNKIQAGIGHSNEYWKDQDKVPIEAFAEFWECIANPAQLKVVNEWLPKSSKVFLEMLTDLLNKIEVGENS